MVMRCKATTQSGQPCEMACLANSDWCFAHAPEKGRERAAARKRGGLNRRAPAPSGDQIPPTDLRDVRSIQELLERVVTDTLAQENSAQRSRTIGYLAGLLLKAVEVGEFEARLAAIESSLGDEPKTRRVA